MNARKLVFQTHCTQIPQTIRNSLLCAGTNPPSSNPPFLPKPPSILATGLLKLYFERGLIREARTLFDEMPERDVVAWTTMISGYTSCNHHARAWVVFCEMMRYTDVRPNEFTFSSTLKACKGINSSSRGALIHGLVLKQGMSVSIYVANALLDVYATCCVNMDEASAVFHEIRVKNDVSWTTLIAGYTHRGDGYMGLKVFRRMLLEEGESNPFSFSIAVRACASVHSCAYGKQLHAAIIKHGLDFNLPVMNSILDMYCRCSSLNDAKQCFREMTQRDSITWNTLIAGYEKSDPYESISIYSSMESEGLSPNCFTFSSVVAAVANLAVLSCGEQIHGRIIKRGLGGNLELDNALIDMYAKSGNIASARRIFDKMPKKNLVSWTSMMIGYGSHGYGNEAVDFFEEMVKFRVRPDRIAFVAVLNACSHAGLVDKGLRYFISMVGDYDIAPDQEIFGCLVDLLGRAGRVEEAFKLIESMPFDPDESVWGAFLGACKAHNLPDLGKLAMRKVLALKPKIAGTYVILSNIYAADGKWGDSAKMRKLMRRVATKKEAGRSSVEIKNQNYSFVAGDKMGSHMDCVYEVVNILVEHMSDVPYIPDFDFFIHDSEDGT
ncbi:PREDICTED: putative pentatricopeptide repeat-containing protein At1g56570 [Nicotiana attenuata]|uniref:Pentatricopeptide repeat-containing protein n=1 Tax=Nicotiana attenuata TaxID=49451 RepID=A0A314KMC2_NICAT|nr:PREDICTED: putative pentatricopeptide repeat-containing protein At1g56570 [Nicotiana attenuata]OIT30327.1 putative pentatricopeptide repeat-containing protein [Nicotiana attenuata]